MIRHGRMLVSFIYFTEIFSSSINISDTITNIKVLFQQLEIILNMNNQGANNYKNDTQVNESSYTTNISSICYENVHLIVSPNFPTTNNALS